MTSFTYQWLRCDTFGANCGDILGETTPTYAEVLGDVGSTFRCRVSDGVDTVVSPFVGPVTATPPPSPSRFWPDTAWPNLNVADYWNPLVNSAQLVSLFAADAAHTGGVYSNGLSSQPRFSTTLYYQRDATTTRVVQQKVFGGSVTIPWNPTWHASDDTDGHCVVVNNDLSYTEFEGLDQGWVGGYGWCAGAAFGNFNDADAIPEPPGRHIAGAPMPAALILPTEIAAGTIPHATKSAAITTSAASVYPSWGSDGHASPGIPMGTWFALPASFDVSPYTGMTRMVAQAWKDHGHFITDTGGAAAMAFLSTLQAGVTYPQSSLIIPMSIVNSLVALHPAKPAYPT